MNIEHAIIDQKNYFGQVIKTETGSIFRYNTLGTSLSNTYEYEQCNTDKTQMHIFRQYRGTNNEFLSEVIVQPSDEVTKRPEITFRTQIENSDISISYNQAGELINIDDMPTEQLSKCINHMRALIAFTQAIDVATEIGVALNVFIKSLNEELLQSYRNPSPKIV